MFLQQAKQASANLETTSIKEIIVLGMEETPEDCKSFMSLVISDDGSLYKSGTDKFDPHTDIVAMPYSSGTTGPPKGVCLTHFNLVANTCQLNNHHVSEIRWIEHYYIIILHLPTY